MTRIAIAGVVGIALVLGAGTPVGLASAQTPPTAGRPAEPRARPRPPSTIQALDRYLRGDFEGAVRASPVLVRFDTREAERWIGAGGRQAMDRRRLAAAAFVLEYSAARPHMAQALVTWARAQLAAAGPPSDVEALWLRATIAFAQGLGLSSFLTGSPAEAGQVAFARARFPSDPYFRLADALASEMAASRAGRPTSNAPDMAPAFDRIEADVRDADPARAVARREALARAAALLTELTDVAAVRAEAHLRLGFVRLRLGDRDAALVQFDQIDALTRDPDIRYLGHLYAGWALESAGRPGEAASAYRAALAVVPHAQSAAVLLTSLLLKDEQLAESELVAGTFLAREEAPHDPWQSYFLGDAPRFWTFVLRLREALR
jgi:tetratricopeptide (TPR) repeat protein